MLSISRILIVSLVVGLALASAPRKLPNRNNPPQNPTRLHQKPSKSHAEEDLSDESPSDQCPEPNGFFADVDQCDKYYECVDGAINERLCPDGMVFNDYSSEVEKCDLSNNIDCSKRPKLQTPIPSQNCPRKNGYYGHSNITNCDTFYYCVDGMFNMLTCPSGLVFNQKVGICTWPDEAARSGCTSADVFNFSCPKVAEFEGKTHPRYPDPDDCQFFYVCINGEIPRRNGCKLGQAFDEEKKHCEWARQVPECVDWYKGRLTDAELDELENPKPKVKAQTRTKGPSRRKQQQQHNDSE